MKQKKLIRAEKEAQGQMKPTKSRYELKMMKLRTADR